VSRVRHNSAEVQLQREWTAAGIGGGMLLIAAGAVLASGLGISPGLIWLLASGTVLVLQLLVVRRHLHLNHRSDGRLLPSLGTANRITLFRGLLIAGLAGFVFLPRSTANVENWRWVPAAIFILASLLDLLDGWTARKTATETELGRKLDTEFDALTILAGGVLALRWEKASLWFILVGLAYYLFRLGCRLRKQRGLPSAPLRPSRIRRPLAGTAMGLTGAVLLPVMSAELGRSLTLIFTIPFLGNFIYDYLTVSRRIGNVKAPESEP
jgi:CDP-diacylglycerol--glycerol-3-phosphate 3-phosphatidyltransferase